MNGTLLVLTMADGFQVRDARTGELLSEVRDLSFPRHLVLAEGGGGKVVAELVTETWAPGGGRMARTEVKVADDDDRRSAHHSTCSRCHTYLSGPQHDRVALNHGGH